MEMDIPDLDELQWLEEANSHLPEHDESYQFHEFVAEFDEGDARQGQSKDDFDAQQLEEFEPPPPPPPQPQEETAVPSIADKSKKRPRSPSPDLDEAEDNWVRVRTESPVDSTLDEVNAWSHSDEQPNIKYLSRFAFEIDGDCMPVTAPSGSGERVYAKLEQNVFSDGGGNAHVGKVKMPATSTGTYIVIIAQVGSCVTF